MPAARSRAVTVASYGGRQPSRIREPAGGGHVRGGEHVLERERDAGQRRRGRAAGVERGVHQRGGLQRGVGGDVQEGVHVGRRRPRSGRGGPARPRRPTPPGSGSSRPAPPRASRISSRHASSPRIRGTRKRPSSAAGAQASACSCVRPGRRSSARKTFCSGTACEVGGISSAATSPTRATAPRMTSSWPANRSSSRVGDGEPGEPGEVRDLVPADRARGVGGHVPPEDVRARNHRLRHLHQPRRAHPRRSTRIGKRRGREASRACCLPPAPA